MTDLAGPSRPRRAPLRAGDQAVPPDDGPLEAIAEPVADAGDLAPPLPPADRIAVAEPANVTIACPNCSEPSHLVKVRKLAEEFCLACDHPLFWLPAFAQGDEDGEGGEGSASDPALRRRPGTAGRRRLAGRPCPSCSEPNDLRAVYCLRCEAPMDPPPTVPVEAPVETPTVLVVPPSSPSVPFWMLVLFAVIGLLVLLAVVGILAS